MFKFTEFLTESEFVKPYLNETFDDQYPVKLIQREEHQYAFQSFTNDRRQILITFHATPDGNDTDDDYYDELEFKPPYTWVLVFSVGSFTSVTGKGDAQKIFATVINAVQQFYKYEQDNIKSIIFNASQSIKYLDDGSFVIKDSRIKLYRRMLKRFSAQYSYKIKEERDGSLTIFTITKT